MENYLISFGMLQDKGFQAIFVNFPFLVTISIANAGLPGNLPVQQVPQAPPALRRPRRSGCVQEIIDQCLTHGTVIECGCRVIERDDQELMAV